MGSLVSKHATSQILMLGPEKAGKTTLLYNQVLREHKLIPNPTVGFQYEESSAVLGTETKTAGFWDIGGGEASQMTLQAITQNVRFNAILFVINITDEIQSIYGGIRMQTAFNPEVRLLTPQSQIDVARRMIHKIMADDEMSYVHTLAIVLNCIEGSPLYEEIFSRDSQTSEYIKYIEDEFNMQKAAGKLNEPTNPPQLPKNDEENPGDAAQSLVLQQQASQSKDKKQGAAAGKEKAQDAVQYPYKEPFLKRMKYSREWLDLGELEMGMNKKLAQESQQHEFIMMDVFDVEKSASQREKFFEKLIQQC